MPTQSTVIKILALSALSYIVVGCTSNTQVLQVSEESNSHKILPNHLVSSESEFAETTTLTVQDAALTFDYPKIFGEPQKDNEGNIGFRGTGSNIFAISVKPTTKMPTMPELYEECEQLLNGKTDTYYCEGTKIHGKDALEYYFDAFQNDWGYMGKGYIFYH